VKNFPILYIFSCHTGAGESGADFLYELAKIIGKPAAGRTGFLYSNDRELSFENGSVWQVATPDTRPKAIEAPSPHFSELPVNNFSVEDGLTIEIPNIKSIVTSTPGAPNLTKSITANPDIHQAIISALFASEPHIIPGAPAAMITSIAEITFKHPNGTEDKRTFNVFNSRLTVDQKSGLAYYASPHLDQLIKSIYPLEVQSLIGNGQAFKNKSTPCRKCSGKSPLRSAAIAARSRARSGASVKS
jgi:hypothetical protein